METIGSLIDKLITANIKVYHLIDIVEGNEDDKIVAEAARKCAKINRERSKLVNEIDKILEGKEMIVKV